eukprot:COSAG01_NODE_14316_length_1469_cov_5.368613_2_plen_362_part_01
MEPEGRILRNEGDVLRPTGGFVHIIPAGLSKPSDFARAREILEECLDAYPDFLIGHAAHKPFKEWNDKCARGRVTGIDKDHAGNTLWQIRYEADGKEEDYDKSDMIQYVIRREFGVSDPDGGRTHQLAKATRAALKLLNQLIPQAGKQAKALAVEVLEIWADADPGFDQYAAQYGGTGRGPFDLLSRFLRPVLNEWSQDLWKQLRADTPFDLLQCPTLASRLERDSMRSRPDWGISTLIERAAALLPAPPRDKRKPKGAAGADASPTKESRRHVPTHVRTGISDTGERERERERERESQSVTRWDGSAGLQGHTAASEAHWWGHGSAVAASATDAHTHTHTPGSDSQTPGRWYPGPASSLPG